TLMFGRRAVRQTDPDYFPLSVASYVLGGGSTSRLYTKVREESGLAYAVYSWVSPARCGADLAVSSTARPAEGAEGAGSDTWEWAVAGRDACRAGLIPRAVARQAVPDRELPVPARHVGEGGRFPRRRRGPGARARLPRSVQGAHRPRHGKGHPGRRGQVLSTG